MAQHEENHLQQQVRHIRGTLGLSPRKRGRPGSAPGTLVFRDDEEPTRLHVIAYGPDDFEERDVASATEARGFQERFPNVWLDAVGLGTEEVIRGLGTEFGLHGLVLEDLINTNQRAKLEPYPEGLLCIVRMPQAESVATEQVSVLLTDGIVITVQERSGDVFEAVRDRIRIPRGQIRHRGCDYLMYAIVDAVVDSYFPVLEAIGERLEVLEDAVMADPTEQTVTELHAVRRELVALRRAFWPHRDMLNSLIRDAEDHIEESTALYVRDAYDHAIQIVDLIDSLRDIAGDLLATYMSIVSNRMNEVMKVLTIIATLFIPLSFVAGLYGMNFDTAHPANMPELSWSFGYPAALGVMLVMALGLLAFFRRKGWL